MTAEQHAIVVRTLLTGVVEHDAPIPVGDETQAASWRWVSIAHWRSNLHKIFQHKAFLETYGTLTRAVLAALNSAGPTCPCTHCKNHYAQR